MRIIISILALLMVVYALASDKQSKVNHTELMVGSFYTGCMGGIVATIEEKLFIEGSTKEQAEQNFLRLKANCKKQQQEYKDFLSNKKYVAK